MKNKMFKRILSLVLVVLMILTAALATGCGKKDDDDDDDKLDAVERRKDLIERLGGASDTYVGSVSEDSYVSAGEAAKAFVTNEVIGSEMASVSGVKHKKTLSANEVSSVIPAEVMGEGVVEVQQLEVTYSVMSGENLKAGNGYSKVDTLDTSRKVDVYVIKYELDWKYFSPCPENDTPLTKSYYDSTFASENFKNCTIETVTKMTMDMKVDGQTQKVDMEMTQTMKYADKKILLTQTVTGEAASLGLSNMNLKAYIEEVDGEMKIYVKMGSDSSWVEGNLYQIGFSSIDELAPFATSYLEFTYFVKTDYGFTLRGENAKKYFAEVFESLGSSFDGMLDNMNIDMTADYIVKDGVLRGATTLADVDFKMEMEGHSVSIKELVEAETVCYDYGTTVVNRPFN